VAGAPFGAIAPTRPRESPLQCTLIGSPRCTAAQEASTPRQDHGSDGREVDDVAGIELGVIASVGDQWFRVDLILRPGGVEDFLVGRSGGQVQPAKILLLGVGATGHDDKELAIGPRKSDGLVAAAGPLIVSPGQIGSM
jgi:hypothetical protein